MTIFTGGCQCGHIRYVLTGEPTNPHFCHCYMCQRLSGAPIVAWVDFPLGCLTYEGAEPTLYRSSATTQRGFCPECGSSIFALDDGSDFICMTVTTLDQAELIIPEYDSFIESAPPWMDFDASKVRSF